MACTPPRSPRMQSEMDRLVFTPRARKASGSPPLKGMSLTPANYAESNVNNQHATSLHSDPVQSTNQQRAQRELSDATLPDSKDLVWDVEAAAIGGDQTPRQLVSPAPSVPLSQAGSSRCAQRLRPILNVDFADASRPEAPGFLTPRTRTPSRIAARKAMQQLLPVAGSPSAYVEFKNAERGMSVTPLRERKLLTHAVLRDMRPVPSPRGFGGAVTLRAAPIVNQHGHGMQRPTWWPSD